MPIQSRAEMMPSVHSGRFLEASVSSMRSTNRPPDCRASAQLYRAVRAPPTWNMPVGDGAKRTRRSVTCYHLVRQCADALDADADLVADLQRADSRGRAGQDHVAGDQRHDGADVGDQGGDVVDELAGAPGLPDLAVDRRGERQVTGVEVGLDPRAERAEGVEALGPGELDVLLLQVAGGDVVGAGVAEDHVLDALDRDLAAQPAD